MSRLGLYGGSFDPIHIGHLLLARQALEDLNLDRVIFVPAAGSPFKKRGTAASAKDRLEMVALAIGDQPEFEMDPFEVNRKPPSYTIHTARAYKRSHPNDELFFLVGEDHAPTLSKWNDFDELNRLVRFVILSRSDVPLRTAYPLVRRRLDISATEIRKRVANNLPISYLVPEKVFQYIQENKLYRGEQLLKPRS
jgi:nicotinate-nucleotide adenylyltransferase